MTDTIRINIDVSDCPLSQYCEAHPTVMASWLTTKLDEIPAEFRESARFEVSPCEDHFDIEFYYRRPMTSTEIAQRDGQAENAREHRRRQLRAELAALNGSK